jgi:hypothetical protein
LEALRDRHIPLIIMLDEFEAIPFSSLAVAQKLVVRYGRHCLKAKNVVAMSGQENEWRSERNDVWHPTQITGDVRKFVEYVLIPNHRSGKDKIFIDLLGYRPNNFDDAQILLNLYIQQAQTKFLAQQYILGERDRHGQRFTIVIEVKGFSLITGWILDDYGILKLATPFAGFAS